MIERFILEELGINTTIVNSTRLRKTAYVVDVDKFEDKVSIMNCRSLPRRHGNEIVYIYAGLTERERKLDEAVSEKAREELAKGNAVKIGYRKLWVNGWEWKWDEEEKKIVKVCVHEGGSHSAGPRRGPARSVPSRRNGHMPCFRRCRS